MRPRSITYRAGRIEETTEMIRHDEPAEDGVYLHRDDICDYIRRIGGPGNVNLPNMPSAIPDWIAEKVRLLP